MMASFPIPSAQSPLNILAIKQLVSSLFKFIILKLSIPFQNLQLARYHNRAIRPLTASFNSTSIKFHVSTCRNCKDPRNLSSRVIKEYHTHTMSSFSNTDTGSTPADPYKAKNLDDASIKEKVEDLSEFISNCKFGMMTTRDGTTGRLVSRCMALAAKVFPPLPHHHVTYVSPRHRRTPLAIC